MGTRQISLLRVRGLASGALGLVLLLALVFSLAGSGTQLFSFAGAEAGASSPKATVTIIHITDLHGALLSEDTDGATGKPIGGAAVVGSWIEAEREKAKGEILLLDSGDMMQGSAISNLSEGAAVIEVMNSLGFEACAVGNHEFDWGIEVLEDRIAQAEFPFLCANVFSEEGKQRPDWAVPSTVLDKGDLKVGIIGVVTTDTPFICNPENLKGLRFDEPAPIVNTVAARLRKEGVQLVVVLAHIGGEQEEDGTVVGPIARFASKLKGVDAVLGGHSHTVVAGEVGSIPVMISSSHGRRVGVMRLEIDLSSGESSLIEQIVKPTLKEGVEPHEGVASIVESFQKKFAGEMERVVAIASERLFRSRQESPLGNLVCDIMREAVGATIAFQNSGGIRADLKEGPITAQEMYRILPFDNTIVTMYLTGEQVKQTLEEGTSERGVVQSSGLHYSYRRENPRGQRIESVTLEDGTALLSEKLYLVATNDYMASGGDRYKIFGQGKEIRNTQILLREAVISWMEALHEAGDEVVAPELGRARLLH